MPRLPAPLGVVEVPEERLRIVVREPEPAEPRPRFLRPHAYLVRRRP
jgi:hypothetical protein